MDAATLNQAYQTVCVTAKLLLRLAKDNPAKTMSITSLFLAPILGSGWLVALPLKVLGFGAAGVGGGTLAAWFQAVNYGGFTPGGSLFSWLQHLGALYGI